MVSAASIRQWIVEPDDGLEPAREFIESAQSTLLIKQFTFTEESLIEAVIGRKNAGVDVRVMLSAQRSGGDRANDETYEQFRNAGIAVQWGNPKFYVTREKSIVVDEKAALVATFNLTLRYFTATRDYGVITHDPVHVGQIVEVFNADWGHLDWDCSTYEGLLWSNSNSRYHMAQFIDLAKHRLDIQHPKYVVAVILERIAAAADRGVKVRILCGGNVLNHVILGIYVVELLIRLTACRWNPRAFAKDKWNVFDFVVVTASFLPGIRTFSMALRLVRVLRIVRIVRFLPELRVALGAIGRSFPGVASLVAATVLLIYIYGMIGWALFGMHYPDQFGNVGQAMLTMFIMLTFSNLPDNIARGQVISDWTILFFISYTVIVGFLLFNLFVGIVLNAMGEARSADRKEHETDDLLARLRAARIALEDAEAELQKTHRDDK